MFRTKLIIIASLFTLSLSTGCLTDETETIDTDPPSDLERPSDDPSPDEVPTDCRLDKQTGELECQEE